MECAVLEESAATAGGEWKIAFEEIEPKSVVFSPSAPSAVTADTQIWSQLDGALKDLLKELEFVQEARPLVMINRVALEIWEYCRFMEGVVRVFMRDDAVRRLPEAITRGEVSSGTDEGSDVLQTLHGYAVQMAFARERMMEKLDSYRAWRYLRKVADPSATRYRLPLRFIKRREAEPEDWPGSLVSVRVGLALKKIAD